MEQNQKTLIIIITLGALAVIALVLGLVLGLKSKDKDKDKEEPIIVEEPVDIMNNYNNTDELKANFSVKNPTTVNDGIEERIQNRLLKGFENWNRGFKTWKAWGNILYTNDSIYNVHGARLSLAHYQAAMDISLKQAKILMGDFHSMLITDDFTAIHYDFITEKEGSRTVGKVMEFVKFKDYGNELGTRVVEGWGSTKDNSYYGLIQFQDVEKEE